MIAPYEFAVYSLSAYAIYVSVAVPSFLSLLTCEPVCGECSVLSILSLSVKISWPCVCSVLWVAFILAYTEERPSHMALAIA